MKYGCVNALTIFIVAMFTGCAAWAQPQPETRQVSVNLHFNVPEGMVIPENYVPHLSGGDKRVYPGVRTGPGAYILSGEYSAETQRVFVNASEWWTWDEDFTTPSTVTQKQRLAGLREMFTRFSLGWPVEVPLVAGQIDYAVTIDLVPAITVTGQHVNPAGRPVGADLYRQGSMNAMQNMKSSRYGMIALGIPKGRNSWLAWNGTDNHNVFRLIHLTALQTTANLNLGTIVAAQESPMCPVDITVTNSAATQAVMSRESDFLTVVALDGRQIIVVSIIDGKGRHEPVGEETEAVIPNAYPESYFVVPGVFFGSPIVQKVIEYCRDGRELELVAAGIPQIRPVTGQTTTLTIDAQDVVNRVNSLP